MSQTILQSENQFQAVSGSTFININGALNTEQTPDATKAYMIDWTKLTSVNDLVLILQMLGIAFPGNHPGISQIQKFLDFQNTIPLDEAQKESTPQSSK